MYVKASGQRNAGYAKNYIGLDTPAEILEYLDFSYRQVDTGYIINTNGYSPERGHYSTTHVAKDKSEIGVIIQQLEV